MCVFCCCCVVLQYLESVRPLLDDTQYERVSKLAAEFESSLGNRLQWYLKLKALWASNYVSASFFVFFYANTQCMTLVLDTLGQADPSTFKIPLTMHICTRLLNN